MANYPYIGDHNLDPPGHDTCEECDGLGWVPVFDGPDLIGDEPCACRSEED